MKPDDTQTPDEMVDPPLRPGPETGADPVTVRLTEVHKAFGERVVLDGLDLTVRKAESMVVIGGSGTGKSVLLKHIIGLLQPDSGQVEIDGVDLSTLGYREITRFRRRFGMAFQEGALFDSMTVGQNIGFALDRFTDLSKAEIRDRVEECLALVRLEGVMDKMPSELSGGMRRRVGFARAIAHEPEILLFDEPTTGLDPVTTALVDEVIIDMSHDLAATTITITHDMGSAFRIADRVGLLYHGKIVAEAPPDEFQHLDDPRVQQFIHGRAEGPLTDSSEHAPRRSATAPAPSDTSTTSEHHATDPDAPTARGTVRKGS